VAGAGRVESSTISLIPTGPPPRTGMGSRVDAEGSGVCNREVLAHSAASDYFSTLKMPLTRGRAWSQADDARARAVAVINETMVRQLWNPIGRHVRDMSFAARRPQWLLNAAGQDGWFEIIGVMRDAPNQGLPEPIAPAIYYPYTAALGDGAVLLVRTKGNPSAAESELRAAVARAYSNLPIIRFGGPEVFFGWQQGQFVSAVLLGFAGVALLLASFGLFSASSYLVASRAREFGIRLAVGATAGAVRWLALKSTVMPARRATAIERQRR
jgi:MacB-like protein/FtsX-like permease family protein